MTTKTIEQQVEALMATVDLMAERRANGRPYGPTRRVLIRTLTTALAEAGGQKPVGLGGDLQIMLNQGAEYLLQFVEELQSRGLDSTAEGAKASAYVITQVIRGEVDAFGQSRAPLAGSPMGEGQEEPAGWAQLGLMNGRAYIREVYDRNPYPPSPDIVRNLNLVPLYTSSSVQASREAAVWRGPIVQEPDGTYTRKRKSEMRDDDLVLIDPPPDIVAMVDEQQEAPAGGQLTAFVDRFLSWPVPNDVCADLCACKPGLGRTGTNLLTAPQTEQMLRHVLGIDHE